MDHFDLLTHVQPSQGFFCIVGIQGKSVKQKFAETREGAQALIEEFDAQKRNVFFAVSKFVSADNRTKDNALAVKSFWLDIDCGELKAVINPSTQRPFGYIDQKAGLEALLSFCELVGLPTPTVVDSGRGLHVYWALEKEVSRKVWEPVAERLRQVCVTQELHVDPAVFEVARILRVPDTYNYKDETPKQVRVIKVSPPVSIELFYSVLGCAPAEGSEEPEVSGVLRVSVPTQPRVPSALSKLLFENIESSFSKIMTRSAKGDGCQQLLSCYVERETVSEPRWFDALSVAKFCSDRDIAVHKMSSGHPDYDASGVERKLAHIVGPHTCEVFARNNPGGCDGCPHMGAVKSPIVLGREILRHQEGTPIPLVQEVQEDSPEPIDREEDAPGHTPAPFYTSPYFRGKFGGIYIQLGDDDEPKLVYEHDLFLIKRLTDPLLGDVVAFRLHSPRDGIREFIIPNTKIAQQLELRKELSKHGVIASEGQFKLITAYVIHALKELQVDKTAEIMRRQFGWADGDTKFIVGDREITKDQVYYSPPSSITESMVPYFEPKGTLEAWKEVFALYGKEGMEVQAFAALTGFGAPLLKFSGQKGAIINLIHRHAGTGKTTVLRMANSIYGHPEELLGTIDDTKVARITKVGILNNIINTVDEITNLEPKVFSELVYAYSQGKGKDKGDAQENKLRINNTTWRTPTLTSSNASFYDKVGSIKAAADGEIMRLLEFKVEYTDQQLISTAEGKHMFDHQLNSNYGHAIVPYIQYILSNMEEVQATLHRVQAKIDKEINLTSRERNWSAVAACNITGGLIAERLGLLVGWKMPRIYSFATSSLQDMCAATKAPVGDASAVVGDYIYRHINNVLVVDEHADKRTNLAMAPRVEPRGELLIRFEPDTKLMYVAINAFRRDCVQYQVDYTETIKELKTKGILVDSRNKRMAKGMSVVAAGVRCLVLNCDNADFVDVSAMVAADQSDASGEGNVPD